MYSLLLGIKGDLIGLFLIGGSRGRWPLVNDKGILYH